MKNEPVLISIVIPVFKTYGFLERLVRSVECQSLQFSVELIFIDDTPVSERQNLQELIESFDSKIPLVSYNNSKNMGVTFSRNKGYFKSRGEYVFFLDSDDVLLKNGLGIIASKLKDFDCSIYLFRVLNSSGGLNGAIAKNEKVYSGITCVADTYGVGECFVGVKKHGNVKPFIGSYRGHELAGLSRFISKVDIKSLYLGKEAVRMYLQDNEHSLSKGHMFTARLNQIVKGHLYLAKLFFNRGYYLASTKWFSKFIIRKIHSIMAKFL